MFRSHLCFRAARLDEGAIQALRGAVGLPDDAFPHLHLSPALRSPKARAALRQPLFASPTPTLKSPAPPYAHSSAQNNAASAAKHATPENGGGAAGTAAAQGHSGARRRKNGPVPEKLDMHAE